METDEVGGGSKTRPDRSEKLLSRKVESEMVVKCFLKGIVSLQGDARDRFMEAVRDRVTACSRRVWNASVAINLLLQQSFDGRDDVADICIPEFWDCTFIRQMMLGTTGTRKSFPEVDALHKLYPELLHNPTGDRFLSDSNMYTFAAKKLSTNIKNHLTTNVPKMLGRMVYSLFDKDQAVAAKYAINGWKVPEYKRKKGVAQPERFPVLAPETAKLVCLARRALGLVEGDCINKKWFKAAKFPVHGIRFLVFANRCLDTPPPVPLPPDYKEPRLCTLTPICGVRNHFVTIDTTCLYGIARDIGLLGDDCLYGAFNDLREDHWRSFLDVDRIKGRNCKFTGTIDTDGIAICIHFTRPKGVSQKAVPQKVYDPASYRVLGVDPGRTNILYMVERLSNGSFKKFVLSRSQYYTDSGIKAANINSKKWNKRVELHIQGLSTTSPKGASLTKFLAFLVRWTSSRDALYTEYSKARWSEQRMRLYGGKKRVFANFLNRVEKGDVTTGERDMRPTVLAYGSAKFAPTGTGELSVPTSRAFKECSARFECALVDEFRTSRTFHKDGTLLQQVGMIGPLPKNGGHRTVRGLLWCCSTSNDCKFVNRDLNAAINILNCNAPKRPSWLTRVAGQPPLKKQYIAKIITW